MTFVIFLSIAAMTVAVVGCVAIWGFDVARAREVERDTAEQATRRIALERAERQHQLEQPQH